MDIFQLQCGFHLPWTDASVDAVTTERVVACAPPRPVSTAVLAARAHTYTLLQLQ